jgi:hypothetical protein
VTDLMQQTRGTASDWTTADPVLEAGQIGVVTDTGAIVIGDGVTAYTGLTPITPGGGGGGGGGGLDALMPEYLKTANMHATYSDDFTGALDTGKWTRRTVTSGDETTDVWNSEEGIGWANVSAGWHYMMPCPSGDFYWHAAIAVFSASATSLFGVGIIDSSGTGHGSYIRAGNGFANVSLGSYVYAGYNTQSADSTVAHQMQIYALSVRKSGTSYSVAGRRCLPDQIGFSGLPTFAAASTWGGTPDRLTIGCAFTDATFTKAAILRANLTT